MNKEIKLIWAYLSIKEGTYDNDYYFYEDGTILHHYDQTMTKLDIEAYVSPSDIPNFEKEKIVSKCKEECSEEIIAIIERLLTS